MTCQEITGQSTPFYQRRHVQGTKQQCSRDSIVRSSNAIAMSLLALAA